MMFMIGILASFLATTQAPSIRLEATRDLWVSDVGAEADGNNGGAGKLKLKSIQEFSLIDFDLAPVDGRIVRKATLHLRSTGEPFLKRVTVGSVASEWVEGTGSNYEKQAGSSSFRFRQFPDQPWTSDGGDLCRVILANGGTIWGMADASPPDKDGWQTIAVDPKVIAARVAGISHGFVIFDDTGSEWKRDGEKFERQLFPNRFVYSRESGRSKAPYLTVELGEVDKEAPESPSQLVSDPANLPSGEAWASWTTPRDRGGSGVAGFHVQIDGVELPGDQVPRPEKPGERVRMRVRRNGELETGDKKPGVMRVRAVDGAGNPGHWISMPVRFSQLAARIHPSLPKFHPGKPAELPRLGQARVAIIDELDKIRLAGGPMIPPQSINYLEENPLWDAGTKEIRLHAAKNEFVAFQVVVQGAVDGVWPRLEFEGPKPGSPRPEFGVYETIPTKLGPLGDPIVPLRKPIDFPKANPRSASLHAEVYVPHDASPGIHRGKLTLEAKGVPPLVLAVALEVWDFTLPDSLSFLPEMNCYGLPDNERDYYRLAHRHRVFLDRVPYSHNGSIQEGCNPKWDGKKLDWTDWDRRFGPYFDGSAFADLPRSGVPVDCFYLPIHENWPTPMKGNYNESYWADHAFTEKYRRDFVEVSRQFAAHFHEKEWDGTLFEGFLNNKVDYKVNGWSRATSPWLLDEPANFQDFWALRFFGTAFHEGFNAAGKGPAKMAFRCDISRPQWQRDSLDDVLDLNIVGGAMRTYRPLVMDRKEADREIVIEYGSTNGIEDSNIQPVAWSLDVWTLGGDGVLPWQTVGNEESWTKPDELSLFYPKHGTDGPVPSVRLKAYRRGQQDVEYLTLWAASMKEPHWAVASWVRESLGLDARRKTSGGEDAGQMVYDRLTPQDFRALRVRIGESLSSLHPAPRRKLKDFRTPKRDLSRMETRLVP